MQCTCIMMYLRTEMPNWAWLPGLGVCVCVCKREALFCCYWSEHIITLPVANNLMKQCAYVVCMFSLYVHEWAWLYAWTCFSAWLYVCKCLLDRAVLTNPIALLWYRKFPFRPRRPVELMFASGAHVQHDTDCTGLFGLRRLIRLTPPAHGKVDMTQPAVTTRQSNSWLLNADFKMLFKADTATITGSGARL